MQRTRNEIKREWKGDWIWIEDLPRLSKAHHEMVYFRRTFQVPADTKASLVINVSADSRYRLYLNGESVAIGPCKSTEGTHFYETIDVSTKLKPGKNVLAAKVIYFHGKLIEHLDNQEYEAVLRGKAGPASVWRSDCAGFLLEGELLAESGKLIQSLGTDENWKCKQDSSLEFTTGPFFAGGVERVKGSQIPHGWLGVEYDDSSWQDAVPFCEPIDSGARGLRPWRLRPRPIPPLYERDDRFERVMRSQGEYQIDFSLLQNNKKAQPVKIPAESSYIVELDAGQLTTAYLQAKMTGGAGTRITIPLFGELLSTKRRWDTG